MGRRAADGVIVDRSGHQPKVERTPPELGTGSDRTDDDEARRVFQRFSTHYQESLRTVLEHTHPDDAAVVAQVLLAMLGTALRKWSVGEWETAQVYDQMSRAVALIFGQPRGIDELGEAAGAGRQ